jgi:hypothetical protein
MAERKWGAITSGATFESLATTIVFFEDPKASLFGRRGKDGGQDARSGDGTRVFQAKHHQTNSAAAAIRDAKSEAKKIEEYRKPAHPRYEQWASVTHWRLVTNADFNPTDKQTWDTEVVPLFSELRLVADYWERATLDGLLDRHPEIHRSYFDNETRVFLSVPEINERLPGQEPFLRREELGPFCGRVAEKKAISEFLAADKLFLVVHGAGGTGKTRLLVSTGDEIAGDGDWQVLWANVESMAATGTWFEAIVPERATLLIVDEPSDESLLRQLAEQLGGRVGRTEKWKVVVAVRSPKDPVLRFLRSARMKKRVQELELPELAAPDAEEMCFQLLKAGTRADLPDEANRVAAKQLSQRFARNPVWLTLAIQHLEDHGDLKQIPKDAEALADEYLREIENSQPDVDPALVRTTLRWVALIGTVNRQDDTAVTFIGERIGLPSVVDVRELFVALVRCRALVERGAGRRFVELKPDVLRDRVLLRWLTSVTGRQHPEVSADGLKVLETIREAVSQGGLSRLERAILVSLARTEFILRLAGHEFDLLGAFYSALETSFSAMSASQRVALADVLESIAHFRPLATALLVGALRRTSAPDETIEGIFATRVVSQANVTLALAWPLFGAAMGAESPTDKEAVLRELCALTEAEADLAPSLPRGLPNDGKRAGALVTRVLEGGPQFWSEYDDTAKQLSTELIEILIRKPPTRGQVAVLDALVQPILETERRQTWSDEHAFTMRTFAIGPGEPAWLAREAVLSQIKKALRADAIPSESRVQFWRIFAAVRDGKALERLDWTREVLTSRSPSIEELAAAREVWNWYRQYEDNPAIKASADALETFYATNDLAKEFQPLLPSVEDWQERDDRAAAKAAELASKSSPEEISAFVERAVTFLGGDQSLHRLGGVSWSLGAHAETRESVRRFIGESLERPVIDARSEFVVTAVVSWIAAVRASAPARAHELVQELLNQCVSDERRAHLLENVYGQLSQSRRFTPEERALLRASRDLFRRAGREVPYVAALGLGVSEDWPILQPLLDEVIGSLQPDRLSHAIHALIDAIHWALRNEADQRVLVGLAEWLMFQVLALLDVAELSGNGEWHLNEILKRVGRPGVQWLSDALRRRQIEKSRNDDGTRSRAFSHRARVSKYIGKIDAADASRSDIVVAIGEMLDFVNDDGTVGYFLPEILRDVDPGGFVTPASVAERIATTRSADEVWKLARIGGAYALNSKPWRTIALAAIRAAAAVGAEALRSVYGSLGEKGIRSWSSTRGEVPRVFITAVDEARQMLDAERQAELMPFWKERLADAEGELHEREERAKEERGE